MLTVCNNHIRVEGPHHEIRRFVAATTGRPAQYVGHKKENDNRNKYFCFNAFKPVPSRYLKEGEYLSSTPVRKTAEGFKIAKRISCGADWSWHNWTADCDVWDQKISADRMGYKRGCKQLYFCFSTFSCPPIRWLMDVFAKFPKLSFDIHYSLRDQFSFGIIQGRNGEYWETETITEAPEEIFM